MKKFELRISDDPIEFTAEDASAFLDVWKSQSKWAFPDDQRWHAIGAASL